LRRLRGSPMAVRPVSAASFALVARRCVKSSLLVLPSATVVFHSATPVCRGARICRAEALALTGVRESSWRDSAVVSCVMPDHRFFRVMGVIAFMFRFLHEGLG